MDLSFLDHEATVTPYQLCHVCKPTISLYLSNWESFDGVDTQVHGNVTIDTLAPDGPPSPFRRHHATFEDLRCAAVGGCHLCAIFLCQVKYHLDLASRNFYIAIHKRENDATRASVSLWCAATLSDYTGPWRKETWIDIERFPDYRGEEEVLSGGMVVSQNTLENEYRWCASTGSKAALDMVAAWLRECVRNHSSCKKNVDVGNPTRLLALGVFSGSTDLRLVHSSEVGNVEYAALSYSWGDRVTTTLKATNLVDFMSRIPFTVLPTIVKEAVKVCKSLDISYLWVDALCIIQEDREDFAQEISRMGSIYAGSVVTVAAADSLHCDSGLFRSRRPLASEDLVVKGHNATLQFDAEPARCILHTEDLKHCALGSRAWTCQERVLAPRTIHFSADEIIWECRKRAMCQRCAGRVRDNLQYDLDLPKREILNLDSSSDETAINYAVQRMWSHVVEVYTPMQLSDEDDRLSALAGIAQLIYEKSGFKASHGLWLPFFADELLWYVVNHRSRQGRNADQLKRMPSWSWASCQSGVHTRNPPLNEKLRPRKVLYRCAIETRPLPTPFGPLSSLNPEPLRVSGWLTLAVAAPGDFENGARKLVPPRAAEREEFDMGPTWPWPDFIPSSTDSLSLEPSPVVSWKTFYWPDEDDRDILGQRLLCLIVERHTEDKRSSDDAIDISRRLTLDEGLVLRMVDVEKRVYRRIGYFEAELWAEQDWAQETVEVVIV